MLWNTYFFYLIGWYYMFTCSEFYKSTKQYKYFSSESTDSIELSNK